MAKREEKTPTKARKWTSITFRCTDEEKLLLLESPVGEGIFFAGTKHVLIKILASYTEEQIITTSPEKVIAIKQAKKERESE